MKFKVLKWMKIKIFKRLMKMMNKMLKLMEMLQVPLPVLKFHQIQRNIKKMQSKLLAYIVCELVFFWNKAKAAFFLCVLKMRRKKNSLTNSTLHNVKNVFERKKNSQIPHSQITFRRRRRRRENEEKINECSPLNKEMQKWKY